MMDFGSRTPTAVLVHVDPSASSSSTDADDIQSSIVPLPRGRRITSRSGSKPPQLTVGRGKLCPLRKSRRIQAAQVLGGFSGLFWLSTNQKRVMLGLRTQNSFIAASMPVTDLDSRARVGAVSGAAGHAIV